MIGYFHPQDSTLKRTGTSHYEPASQPQGRFVLIPAQNGTLLIKSIAVQELMLPCQVGNHAEEPSGYSLKAIEDLLDQVV